MIALILLTILLNSMRVHIITFVLTFMLFKISDINGQSLNLFGSDSVYLEVYRDTYIEAGYIALSHSGANITSQVTVTSTLDTTKVGTYLILYSFADTLSFIYTKARTVIVRDTQKPVIFSISGNDTIKHQLGTPFNIQQYISVKDNYWVVSSASIQRTGYVNYHIASIYSLNFNFTDSSGNSADEYTAYILVKDEIPPTISLKGSSEILIDVFTTYIDPGVFATDDNTLNPIITVSVVPGGYLNVNILNTYTVTYNATDIYGNSSKVQRIVRVVDRQPPEITMLGDVSLRVDYIKDNPLWWLQIDPGVIARDNYDHDHELEVIVDSSTFNRNIPGTYYITYFAIDKSANISNKLVRTVELNFPVGLNDIVSNSFMIYPNPNSGVFYIRNNNNFLNARVKVYDIANRELMQTQIYSTDSDKSIDMTNYNNGVYFIEIEYDGNMIRNKIILTDK